MEYEIVSVRIQKKQAREIEELARIEMTDKSSIIRKSLEIGLREYRIWLALQKLINREVSLWEAAEIAGVDYREMLAIIKEKRISFPLDKEDLEEELSEGSD